MKLKNLKKRRIKKLEKEKNSVRLKELKEEFKGKFPEFVDTPKKYKKSAVIKILKIKY